MPIKSRLESTSRYLWFFFAALEDEDISKTFFFASTKNEAFRSVLHEIDDGENWANLGKSEISGAFLQRREFSILHPNKKWHLTRTSSTRRSIPTILCIIRKGKEPTILRRKFKSPRDYSVAPQSLAMRKQERKWKEKTL